MRVLLLVGALLAYSPPVFAQSAQKLEPVGQTTGTSKGSTCKVDVTFKLTETGGAEVLRYKAKCRLNRTDKADLKVEVYRIIAELDFSTEEWWDGSQAGQTYQLPMNITLQ
jgi:hypothetical protein